MEETICDKAMAGLIHCPISNLPGGVETLRSQESGARVLASDGLVDFGSPLQVCCMMYKLA